MTTATATSHYREAERLLAEAGDGREPEAPVTLYLAALAHAVLALAADAAGRGGRGSHGGAS